MDSKIFSNALLYLIEQLSKNKNSINKTKLHKLFWFSTINYINKTGRLPFEISFIANHHGPTSTIGINDIENYEEYNSKNDLDIGYLSELYLDSLNETLQTYGGKSAAELSRITHKEGTAWSKSRDFSEIDFTLEIENSDVKELFEEYLEEKKVFN